MHICILSGSTLGGAEYVAEHLNDVLETQGFSTALFHGPSLSDIENEKIWLVVFDKLAKSQSDFSDVRFAVVGLGNSDYDTFCYAADKVEQTLQEKSAVKICETLKIDVLNVDDQEGYAEAWLPNFIEGLK